MKKRQEAIMQELQMPKSVQKKEISIKWEVCFKQRPKMEKKCWNRGAVNDN